MSAFDPWNATAAPVGRIRRLLDAADAPNARLAVLIEACRQIAAFRDDTACSIETLAALIEHDPRRLRELLEWRKLGAEPEDAP